MALPPGCSFPGPRDSAPLSPSPLPAWQPRRHAPAAVGPMHGGLAQLCGPHGDAGAGALLAGAFPPGAAFMPLGGDERLGGHMGAAAGGARGRRSRLMPMAMGAAAAGAGGHELHDAAARGDRAAAAAPPPADAPGGPDDDSDDGSGGARPKKRPAARLLTRPPGSGCVECGATSTPVWRTGPRGPKTLCNRWAAGAAALRAAHHGTLPAAKPPRLRLAPPPMPTRSPLLSPAPARPPPPGVASATARWLAATSRRPPARQAGAPGPQRQRAPPRGAPRGRRWCAISH
jgi:hypothetical protein